MGTNKVVFLKQKAIRSYRILKKEFSLQKVTSGVPRGSILGPLLFLQFINELPKMMQEVESYGYADDFKATARNKIDMNKATEAFQKWLETDKMKLITKKSHS